MPAETICGTCAGGMVIGNSSGSTRSPSFCEPWFCLNRTWIVYSSSIRSGKRGSLSCGAGCMSVAFGSTASMKNMEVLLRSGVCSALSGAVLLISIAPTSSDFRIGRRIIPEPFLSLNHEAIVLERVPGPIPAELQDDTGEPVVYEIALAGKGDG